MRIYRICRRHLEKNEIQNAKETVAKVICFASTAPLATMLIERGADALILEGSEAGGHIGPVALSVLVQQILFKVDSVPIFVAGGIATGRMMAHLLMMGDAGRLGSSHIAAAAVGMLVGGVIVAIATKALPAALSRAMSRAMQQTMARQAGEGCDPEAM